MTLLSRPRSASMFAAFALILSLPSMAEDQPASDCREVIINRSLPIERPEKLQGKRLDPSRLGAQSQEFVDAMNAMVLDQSGGVNQIAQVVTRLQMGLVRPNQPQAALLFLGSSGIGKTETVRTAAQILHGSSDTMVRIDCAEYQEDHEIAKLIGSPPGYLGHKETSPRLSQKAIDSKRSEKFPYTLILFDEVEKSSPALSRLLLGALSTGKITLGDNTTVDLTQTIIVFTSNLGNRERIEASSASRRPKIGFLNSPRASLPPPGAVEIAAARSFFSSEFMGRLSGIEVFQPLSIQAVAGIFDMKMEKMLQEIRTTGYDPRLYVTQAARRALVATGYSPAYGARQLQIVIDSLIKNSLLNLSQTSPEEDVILIDVTPDGELTFEGLSHLNSPAGKRRMRELLKLLEPHVYGS